MVGVHHRWKQDNEVPLLPAYVAVFLGLVVGMWLFSQQAKYGKAERRVLCTALILAVALGAIGWLIISLIEPYQDVSGG
jgi:hypothetical protein